MQLELQMPSDVQNWDTSCVTTIEVFTDGKNYPADSTDYNDFVVTIDPQGTMPGVESAVRGKLDVPIPPSGLSGVELYAWAGTSGFADNEDTGELIFSAYATTVGQDTLVMPLIPTVNCPNHATKVRPLDIIKYIQPLTATPQPAPDCAAAAMPDDTTTVEIGSLSPARYVSGLLYWGSPTTASLALGGTSVTGPTTMGPAACLATRTRTAGTRSGTIACANYSTGACGKSLELELPYIDPLYAMNSADPALLQQYGAVTVGVVVHSNGTANQNVPVPNATITVDTSVAKVVYVDIQPSGKKLVPKADATATTSSGMFMVYSDEITSIKATAGAMSKTVVIGATPLDEYKNATVPGGVTILLN